MWRYACPRRRVWEILSPVPVSGKCNEKDYERLFIRNPEVKAREGKMAYVRPEYHDRIMRIIRVIGHDRLNLSAYIDHVLTHHFNQCEDAIKAFTPGTTIQYSNQKREYMNETISMTDILLAVSVGCNLCSCSCFFTTVSWKPRCSGSSRDYRIVAVAGKQRDKRARQHIRKSPRQRRTLSVRAVSGWHPPGQPLPYRRNKPPLRKKALSCRRKRLL